MGTFNNRKTRLDFARRRLKKASQLQMIPTQTFIRIMEREKSGEGKEQLMIKSATSCVSHGGGSVMGWVCRVANGMDSLLLIDNITSSINNVTV